MEDEGQNPSGFPVYRENDSQRWRSNSNPTIPAGICTAIFNSQFSIASHPIALIVKNTSTITPRAMRYQPKTLKSCFLM